MAPVTELATLSLAAGATIEDPSTPAGKFWKDSLDTVAGQPGYQRAYYGRKVEDASVVQLFIDWDSIDSHRAFMKSDIYGPFAKQLMSLIDGPISMMHAQFDPHPPSAAVSSTTSPVTEVITCYFSAHDDGYDQRAKKLANEVLKEKAEGFRAAASGWVIEDVEHECFGGEGKKGKVYVAVVGWESVEAHMKFREAEAFGENIQLLREGPVKLEMHHTTFAEV